MNLWRQNGKGFFNKSDGKGAGCAPWVRQRRSPPRVGSEGLNWPLSLIHKIKHEDSLKRFSPNDFFLITDERKQETAVKSVRTDQSCLKLQLSSETELISDPAAEERLMGATQATFMLDATSVTSLCKSSEVASLRVRQNVEGNNTRRLQSEQPRWHVLRLDLIRTARFTQDPYAPLTRVRH